MPLAISKARAAASLLANAYRTGQLLKDLPGDLTPASLGDGYVVQDLMIAALGLEPVGWKIGLTDKAAQAAKELDEPVRARLFAFRLMRSPCEAPAPPGRLMLEAEFVFRAGRRLALGPVPLGQDEILDSMDAVHLGLELCASRFTGETPLTVPVNLADNSFHGALIVGPPLEAWRSLDLASIRVELFCNQQRVAAGGGARVLGNPVNALVWLVNSLRAEGRAVEPGAWISTGSCIGAPEASANIRAKAVFHGLGSVDLLLGDAPTPHQPIEGRRDNANLGAGAP